MLSNMEGLFFILVFLLEYGLDVGKEKKRAHL